MTVTASASLMLEGAPAGARVEDELVRIVEALLFLAPDPLTVAELAEATEAEPEQVVAALERLHAQLRAGVARPAAARGGGRL